MGNTGKFCENGKLLFYKFSIKIQYAEKVTERRKCNRKLNSNILQILMMVSSNKLNNKYETD